MALHRLTTIDLGVPNVAATQAYYTEFGLTPGADGVLATADGGDQLRVRHADRRRLLRLGVGAENPDDLDRVARSLAAIDVPVQRTATTVSAYDPGTEVTVEITVAPAIVQVPPMTPVYNLPGDPRRGVTRSGGLQRPGPVRPRKLGHVVLGSIAQVASQRFFTAGLGFKVSDSVPGRAAFLRCSTDHHNVLVQNAPLPFLHHTSWQVDDVDEVGRGAGAMLEADPSRHIWGLGRHHVGSNFFWYLKDPAGNFSEYYADLDCIVDDALWEPGVWEGKYGLFNWGPPPPPSFFAPEDLAALMTGAHAATAS